MFLATTALSEFWEKDDEILFLGPWCLRYDRQDEWGKLKYSVLPNPWADVTRIRETAEYCNLVIEHALGGLVPVLNEAHATSHSQRYWRILLGPWLLYYTHSLYDRYIHLQKALELHTDARTVHLDPACFKTPIHTLDFAHLAYEEPADLYNLQLYSQILSALQRRGPCRRPTDGNGWDSLDRSARDCCNVSSLRDTASRIRRLGNLALGKVASAVPHVAWTHELHLRSMDVCRLLYGSHFRFRPLDRPLPSPNQNAVRNEDARRFFNRLAVHDEFERVLCATLAQNFPLVYLEGYESFRAACMKLFPKPPQVLFSSAGWYLDEGFKFVAAECSEKGSRLVGSQHGGGYGMGAAVPQERHEWGISDVWCSYGWKPRETPNRVIELPHPRFGPLGRRSNQKAFAVSGILLVTTSHPRYLFRFESHPVGTFEHLLEWRSRFVRNLLVRVRDRLAVRLSGQDYGWCHEQRLVDACGPLAFDYGRRPLHAEMRRQGLVIIEYPGTAMLEALGSNVPTLLFWDPALWPFREEAQGYITALRNCGILWDSPEGAATKVMDVCEDPAAWWEQSAVQRTREKFVDHYALWRQDWLDSWIHMLNEQAALSRMRK